jgi:pSer/pThr/pTyr-binding forkhead associated (FHA) protein
MHRLHILSEGSVAQTIELTAKLITVGRTEENQICLPHKSMSGRHGILVRAGDEYQVHDFNSTNGTYVNGAKIIASQLKHGDSVRFGHVEARYESKDVPAPEPAKPADAAELKPSVSLRTGSPISPAKTGIGKVSMRDVSKQGGGSRLEGGGPVTLQPGFSSKKPE